MSPRQSGDTWLNPSADRPTGGTMSERRARALGKKDGRHGSRWRFGLPPWEEVEAIPALNATEAPPNAQAIKHAAQEEIERLFGVLMSRWAKLTGMIAEEKDACDKLKKNLDKSGRAWVHEDRFPSAIYYPLLFFIGVAEFLLNGVVFQVLGQKQTETWIIALGLGIILPLIAHFLGGSIKKASGMTRGAWLLLGVVALLLLAIVVLRTWFVMETTSSGLLTVEAPAWLITVVLLIVNVAIFAGAAFMAYHHAFTDPQFEKDLTQYEVRQARMHDQQAELNNLERRYDSACREIGAGFQGMVAAYCDANLEQQRKGGGRGGAGMQTQWSAWYPADVRRDLVFQDWDPEEPRTRPEPGVVAATPDWFGPASGGGGDRPSASIAPSPVPSNVAMEPEPVMKAEIPSPDVPAAGPESPGWDSQNPRFPGQ